MRTIHKYKLNSFETNIALSLEHKVLLVAMQANNRCIWIEVVKEPSTLKNVLFKVLPTGAQFNKGTHVGSFLEDGGSFVWHVYKILT